MTEIKSIKGKKEFEANGHRYTIMDKLSVERWIAYEKLQPQVTFGATFNEMYSNLLKAFSLLNQPKPEPVNAGIILHNLMNCIQKVQDEKRIHPALQMAALFIVREDEDLARYDAKLDTDKINDWQQEGLNMLDFFQLALSSIQGFKETLLRSTLEQTKNIEAEIKS